MTTQSFLGIPVDGDIIRAEHKTAQRPLAELSPLMQAVLDDPGIACFGWTQYTPYFNDGEPCVFRVNEAWFARPEDASEDEDGEFDTDGLSLWSGHLGSCEGGNWVPDPARPGRNVCVGAHYTGPDQGRYDRCKLLGDALESDAFDEVLLEAFGDHAEITVKRDGITVEFYDHD